MGKRRRRSGYRTVFRLEPHDVDLIRSFGRVGEEVDRWTALHELVSVVDEIVMPERKPICIRIPQELSDALDRAHERTGRTRLDILLEAARIYRGAQ
jgi:hypothetical protein